MRTEICLGKVIISAIQQNAGVFYGENSVEGWKTRSKSNAALGRINGDRNTIASRFNFVNDPDIFDMWSEAPDA
ncbi:hypothetical protein [Desulfoscipio gibsoniae]|uniref:Uncharacterized protein n=1 Tax=Desulfoscipio gibsoniae DSM 7213 TaxID=767817 RepID=R4KLA6_9FIRM|nr:hypothetical protein [Desulfoscipio gibsoniae]AGL02357.1 hypothetical protein Desgi_2970 [Desulfoscipio gibsoniae DSM 7213]